MRIVVRLLAVAVCASGPVVNAEELVSPDGGFAATFPCAPSRAATPLDTPDGRHTMHSFVCEAKGFAVFVGYLENQTLDGDAQTRLDGSRDGLVKRISGGKVTAEEKLPVGGQPARFVRVEGTNEVALGRMVLVRDRKRLFTVLAGGVKAGAPEADMRAFVGSFRLIGN